MTKLGQYVFSDRKNALLQQERGIGFEEIIRYIDSDALLEVIDHPNQATYPTQKFYVIAIDGYAWMVPHKRDGENVILITAYKSRSTTKRLGLKGAIYEN